MIAKTRIIVFFVASLGFSQDNPTLFTQATEYYNQGDYPKAIAHYEQILQNGEHSAALYYNLGNCYYKRNAVGPSIYYYEKALLLDPNDQEILNNLSYAQNMRIDAIEPLPQTGIARFYARVVHFFSFDQWAYGAVIWGTLFVLAYGVYLFLRVTHQKKIAFISSLLCFLLSIGSVVMAYVQYREFEQENPAIIFSREAPVASEPNTQSEVVFTLHEGTKVEVVEQLKDWSKIQLANGQTGWIQRENFRLLKDF